MKPSLNSVIVSAVRTPMGSFNGVFTSVPATKLGSVAIAGALQRAGVSSESVDGVYMGCVLSAGLGPARRGLASLCIGCGEALAMIVER